MRLRVAQNAPDDLAQLLSAAPARVQVLRELQHKNIVKLQDAYETPSSLILVCELATGGELMHRIAEERSVYTEEEVKRHLLVMLDTIKYMHDQGAPPQVLHPPTDTLERVDTQYTHHRPVDTEYTHHRRAAPCARRTCVMHPGVVHRDLKPENILLSDKSANAHILIAGTAPIVP